MPERPATIVVDRDHHLSNRVWRWMRLRACEIWFRYRLRCNGIKPSKDTGDGNDHQQCQDAKAWNHTLLT